MIPFAASLLLKATVIAALALAATRLARRTRAAVRHVLLVATFAALAILPMASLLAPSIQLAVPIAVPQRIASLPDDTIASDRSNAAGATGAAAPGRDGSPWPSWPALASGIWSLGALLCLLPVAAGLSQVRSLRRSGLPWRDGQPMVDALAREAGIGRAVDVLLHEAVAGPMTCGTVRPVIVLPIDARRWPDGHLRTAIVHELEHVRRGDWISQCVARAVCAGYWFHPLVWIASRQLSLEAERASDDGVLRRVEATAYADQLVVLAERLSAAATQPVLAMANRHDLAARVSAVLDSSQPRGRAGRRWLTLGGALSVLVVSIVSPLRVVATAQVPAASPTASQRFAAVSIKPCAAESAAPVAGPRGRGGAGGNVTASPGALHIDCSTLQSVIDKAYVFFGQPLLNESGPPREETPRVKGGPAWVRAEKFMIEAKAEGPAPREVMMGPMLRAFFEDRLQLKTHRDVEDVPMYSLTVAKGGLKIKPVGEGGCAPYDPEKPPPAAADASLSRPGALPVCGSLMRGRNGALKVVDLGGMELEILMTVLNLDRPVVDRTGITDRFNIHLEYADEAQADAADPSGPNVFRALEQQLGLKLEPVKAPHGFLVIDRIVHP